MPPLPKKRKSKEADITPRVIAWFEKNYPYTVALEIKVDNNKLLPHQESALKTVGDGVFSYKIPDGRFRNPFDAIVLQDAHPYVVRCTDGMCRATRFDKEDEWFQFTP